MNPFFYSRFIFLIFFWFNIIQRFIEKKNNSKTCFFITLVVNRSLCLRKHQLWVWHLLEWFDLMWWLFWKRGGIYSLEFWTFWTSSLWSIKKPWLIWFESSGWVWCEYPVCFEVDFPRISIGFSEKLFRSANRV